MSFIVNWVKNWITYYTFRSSPTTLIDTVNTVITISDDMKQVLTASIIANDASKFVEQVNGEKNISQATREELMSHIECTSQPCSDSLEQEVESSEDPKPEELITVDQVNCDTQSANKPKSMIEYRGFMISDNMLKGKVDAFFDMKPSFHEEMAFMQDTVSEFNTPENYDEMEAQINVLYNMSEMWDAFEKYQLNNSVVQWACKLKILIVRLIRHQLTTIEKLSGKRNKADYVQNEVQRIQIKYSKLFTHHILGAKADTFLKTAMLKLVEFITIEGLPSSLLTFAHYRPDLVCDDIHPIINRRSDMYGKISSFRELEESPIYGQLYQKFQCFL
jgi:hypothetical protein